MNARSLARQHRVPELLTMVLVGAAFAVAPAYSATATFFYDFDTDSILGGLTSTPFVDVSNGVMASFSSPGDPGAFAVLPTIFKTLTGNVLFQPLPGDLSIVFDREFDYVSLLFATTGSSSFTLKAFDASNAQVGSVSATGAIPSGGFLNEGRISFGGVAFQSIQLSSADNFAIDEITNAPEPGTMVLLGFGIVALGVARRWARQG